MDSDTQLLSLSKQFEANLKKCLVAAYGKNLPQDKVTLLNMTEYVDDDLVNNRNRDQIQGEMTRKMMDDMLDIECFKDIKLEDGDVMTFPYGTSLQMSLVEFYTYELSQKYHFSIDEAESLAQDLEVVQKLLDVYGDEFDSYAFNSNALELLDDEALKELANKYDDEAVQTYFENVKSVGAASEEEQDIMLRENAGRNNSLQIVYINDKKNIKYTDNYGKVHLMDITNMPSVENYYKKKIAALMPGEKLDPEKFFYEVKKEYADEMNLESTSDVKKDDLNNEQVDMLDFVKSNPEISAANKEKEITHSTDQTVHVVEDSDDIVITEDKMGHVESNIIKDGYSKGTKQVEQDISSKMLTKEEYILLNDRFMRHEYLTDQELEALKRAAPIYAEELREEQEQKMQEEKPAVLKPSNTTNTGFTIKTFALYFVVLTLLIGSVVAIILLS